MLQKNQVPIQEITLENTTTKLFIKREDLIHPFVSGNKFWKLKLALENYANQDLDFAQKCIISFGGAFSNHITALAYACNLLKIKSIGLIRGEELANFKLNPSLLFAKNNSMDLHFVTREQYRDKKKLEKELLIKFPNALIIPEGGSNDLAVKGIKPMLDQTKDFDYICSAVGTGGTFAGLVKFSENHQKCIGVQVVNDITVKLNIEKWSEFSNFELIQYHNSRYGELKENEIIFMNWFYEKYQIKLDPIYTVKLLKCIFEKIYNNEFPKESKILCFHTGGMQSLKGMKEKLAKKNSTQISY